MNKTTPTKRGRVGRPKVLPDQESITIAVQRDDLRAAEQLVPEFDRLSALGVRHTRMDVLRQAIKLGIAELRYKANYADSGKLR